MKYINNHMNQKSVNSCWCCNTHICKHIAVRVEPSINAQLYKLLYNFCPIEMTVFSHISVIQFYLDMTVGQQESVFSTDLTNALKMRNSLKVSGCFHSHCGQHSHYNNSSICGFLSGFVIVIFMSDEASDVIICIINVVL